MRQRPSRGTLPNLRTGPYCAPARAWGELRTSDELHPAAAARLPPPRALATHKIAHHGMLQTYFARHAHHTIHNVLLRDERHAAHPLRVQARHSFHTAHAIHGLGHFAAKSGIHNFHAPRRCSVRLVNSVTLLNFVAQHFVHVITSPKHLNGAIIVRPIHLDAPHGTALVKSSTPVNAP